MVTISHITKKILQDKLFIHEALEKELVNLGALADMIKPQIEEELEQKVKTSTISMAIRRYLEKKKQFLKKIKLSKKTDLLVKSNLFEITLSRTSKLNKTVTKLYQIVNFNVGDTLNIIYGNYEVLIISNDKYKKKFLDILKNENIQEVQENISSISIKIPQECLYTPGFYFAVTKLLLLENIPIIDIVNTKTEATFILFDRDIPKSYSVLKKGIDLEYYK
ncbi:MAG: hypothetical protein KAT77_03865 [Nanoarchaeota archaeon]|nr:hypothetical protein [Nanoarchaeota archaeon]